MQITFYDKNMFETAVADNALMNAIKIKKASLASLFEEATHQVEFEFSKEFGEWWGIKENGYLAFRFKGDFFRFSIVKFKEDAKTNTITIVGDYFNLEMLNENCIAYEKQPARTIVQHLTAMEILPYANFEIGINELASSSRVLAYTGDEVKYKRLISIINNFGGECEFEIKQKANGQFDKLILNIYKANNGVNYQGVGRNRRDLEITIDNSNNVSRMVDSTEIKTSIEPIGKDGLRLGNRGTTWKNEDGQVEFYQKNNRIYAPLAANEMQRVLDSDKFLLWKQSIDTDNVAKLESEGLKWLKNVCYAKENIEVSGSFDVRVGDTVILNHKGIGKYGILGSLRVTKIVWDLLTETNEVTFSNFKRLASKISAQGLALQNSIESPASYDIAFNTTAGQVFKNNTGVSTVSFNFKKNGLDAAVIGQRWYSGTQLLSTGLEFMVKPANLTNDLLTLRLEVDVTTGITFSKEITFLNVNDGAKGDTGNGVVSTENYYLVSASKTGISSTTVGWVKDTPQIATVINKYHWHYHVDIYSNGTRKETTPAIIGIYGDKGTDGVTYYPHTAWANSADGTNGFTTVYPNLNLLEGASTVLKTAEGKGWDFGTLDSIKVDARLLKKGQSYTYSVWIQDCDVEVRAVIYIFDSAGSHPYTGSVIPAGSSGFSTVTFNISDDSTRCSPTIGFTKSQGSYHNLKYSRLKLEEGSIATPYMQSASEVTTDDWPRYIGQYTDITQADSTNPSDYTWSLMRGNDGKDGISITNTVTTNALATSGTTAPTSGWSATMPTLIKGQFLWTKIELTLSDSTTKTSYFVTYIPNDGINGQTPVVHTAYANSQNGAVDFSLTDSTNKRYIGQYVDYSTTNSTDYTKYKWVDMVGSVSVGVNLLKNSATRVENSYYQIAKYDLTTVPIDGETYTITIFGSLSPTKTQFNIYNSGGSIHLTPIKKISTGIYSATFVWKSTYTASDGTVYTADNSHIRVYAAPSDNTISSIDKIILTKGNVFQDHSQAPEDIDAKIDTKADQLYTQQQILALEEKTTLERENAIAEAMQNTISEVEQKWQLWYETNTKDEKQQVANDIASLMQRTAELDYKLGEASAKFSFINNETIIGEDGVAIGDKAGKAKLFMSGDSISFLTNGVAQMTLTGDTLSIKNGLFTERIQIGNFVEEVYDKNPLFNVTRAIKNS